MRRKFLLTCIPAEEVDRGISEKIILFNEFNIIGCLRFGVADNFTTPIADREAIYFSWDDSEFSLF